MRSFIFLFIIGLFFSSPLRSAAQDSIAFKPSGKIIARGFFDYHKGFGAANNESGFDVTRALLGYNYQITPTLQAQVVIDGASGRNADGKLEVYLRNAFIRWQDKGFDISLGEIGLLQFSLQEKYWRYRYVLKSFQDLNKMSPSVDLGITAQYQIAKFLSADISLTNGEGYKKIEQNKSNRYAAGINIIPIQNTIFRIYTDIYNDGKDIRDKLPKNVVQSKYGDQKTIALFAGYQNSVISAGAEYNHVFNKGFIQDKNYFGYSVYGSYKFADKWSVYSRYDWMNSKTPMQFIEQWNDLDGQLTIFGIEYQPLKQLKISPNFRNTNPNRNKSEQYFFVNLEFNL